MGHIYIIKNKINEKIYIGQTTRSIEKRFEEHQKGTKGCRGIRGAIKKYGWNNFEIDWYECPNEDLNFDEELLVREMGTLSPDGYNLREGGGSRGKASEESKRKMSEAQSGKQKSDETKQKMSEAQSGKQKSDETKQKMSEAKKGDKHPMFGKKTSDETKQKMSEAQSGDKHPMFGKPHTDGTKQKMSEAQLGEKNHNSKRVYQYDLDGKYIQTFGSCEEAGRHINKKGSHIRTCARGELKTAYKFKWSYTSDG